VRKSKKKKTLKKMGQFLKLVINSRAENLINQYKKTKSELVRLASVFPEILNDKCKEDLKKLGFIQEETKSDCQISIFSRRKFRSF